MARTAARRTETAETDEVPKLLALWVRLQVGSQAAAIVELNRVGIGPTRIAELLGTTVGTVNVTLQRSKKRPKGKTTQGGEGMTGDD
jgi:hypothetical protein